MSTYTTGVIDTIVHNQYSSPIKSKLHLYNVSIYYINSTHTSSLYTI